MQKRLKLITLPWELEVPALSLASLAAVTPKEFEIAIVDLLRERLVLDEPFGLVGISASTPRIRAAYALASMLRARGAVVVIGGHHATAMPEEALQYCDAVVVGEGEASWKRICDDYLTHPGKVRGIYKDPAPDLSKLPQPRIDLMHIERYADAWYAYPLIASRGCPEACTFCFAKKMTLGYRTYPISHVIEQVKRRPKFVKATYFVDDNLPADPDYTKELFAALKKLGVPWGMQARHEFSADPANLAAAKEAGCALISSGYESIDQDALDGAAKRADAETYRQTIHNIFEAGILPSGNWVFGFDEHGPDIFERTLDFLERSDLVHCSFTTEIAFPGTAMFKRYEREGRILTRDYDEYVGKDHVVVRPKGMTPEQLRDGVRWLALQFYSAKNCHSRAIRGLKNEKLPTFGKPWMKYPALLGLNYFQLWQWHYRMVPAVQWLYQRLISVNKYRYFKDLMRGTNFWTSDLPGAEHGEAVKAEGPFAKREGFKRGRNFPLVTNHERPRAPN